MKPTQDIEALLDAMRGRRLTAEEFGSLQRLLEGRPEDRRRLDEELALNQALDSRTAPAVSSNFLARVETRIAAEDSAGRRTHSRPGPGWSFWRWRFLTPAIPIVTLTLALGGWWQYRMHQRGLLATSLATLAPGSPVPGMESLQDFDAVQWLRSGP
ncbi:MAG: hypothetical protein J0L84_18455, partial [Verrucomicrobia bacterium]|nr:hypothetical protein [Verrucomicrobiota bacterium]